MVQGDLEEALRCVQTVEERSGEWGGPGSQVGGGTAGLGVRLRVSVSWRGERRVPPGAQSGRCQGRAVAICSCAQGRAHETASWMPHLARLPAENFEKLPTVRGAHPLPWCCQTAVSC